MDSAKSWPEALKWRINCSRHRPSRRTAARSDAAQTARVPASPRVQVPEGLQHADEVPLVRRVVRADAPPVPGQLEERGLLWLLAALGGRRALRGADQTLLHEYSELVMTSQQHVFPKREGQKDHQRHAWTAEHVRAHAAGDSHKKRSE
eukprot:CAMPEP_0204597038 /NCGR_PEP_ID=MMETSP0661-20131031/53587_1 /ASSEMBLY_ACC=CAM_ASM_000606 /TAXON_ID=109239 /ORGANISM="Alexandrium margalefi, Strain AMGDE01CS-322" /LENGTH=148 /DNA_ID=CAMNT_0051607711 /DNA_START=141 /DNA_END=586 /DNA_ORIENTATION=-